MSENKIFHTEDLSSDDEPDLKRQKVSMENELGDDVDDNIDSALLNEDPESHSQGDNKINRSNNNSHVDESVSVGLEDRDNGSDVDDVDIVLSDNRHELLKSMSMDDDDHHHHHEDDTVDVSTKHDNDNSESDVLLHKTEDDNSFAAETLKHTAEAAALAVRAMVDERASMGNDNDNHRNNDDTSTSLPGSSSRSNNNDNDTNNDNNGEDNESAPDYTDLINRHALASPDDSVNVHLPETNPQPTTMAELNERRLLAKRGRKNAAIAGSEAWKQQRKDSHKEVERRRRENINQAIDTLSKLLPLKETSKAAILNRAAEYIQKLKETENANIEKWTLQKLLSEQNTAQLSSANEKLQQDLRKAYQKIDYMRRLIKENGVQYVSDDDE